MKKLVKRVIAVAMCLVMVLTGSVNSYALSDDELKDYAKQAASAGIQKALGAIPVVGDAVSEIAGTFLPGIFGISSDHAQVMSKLNEISSQIKNVDLKLDMMKQDIFQEFTQQRIDGFDIRLNDVKGTFDFLYNRLMEIEEKYVDGNQDEKMVSIATLIESNNFSENSTDMSKLISLSEYVGGTQISNRKEDGIYQIVYKLNCADSVLGCEAARKSEAYVNSLSNYIEVAYKTLFTIAMAKMYVCENRDRIIDEMNNKNIMYYDISNYTLYDSRNIRSAVFGSNSSLLEHYNMLFDENRSDSAINAYNNMIADYWFSYIDDVDYSKNPINVSYIHLSPEMGFADASTLGFGNVANDDGSVADKMMKKTRSVLTDKQLERLMGHFGNNSSYGSDTGEKSFVSVLVDCGFNFDAYNEYVDSLPKNTGLGAIYRDPNKNPAETDQKIKVMITDYEIDTSRMALLPKWMREDDKPELPYGWIGFRVKGYDLRENVSYYSNSSQFLLARVCCLGEDGYKKDDVVLDDRVMLLYFQESPYAAVGSIFGNLSGATIPIICIGAALIIGVPAAVIVSRKKKAKKQGIKKNSEDKKTKDEGTEEVYSGD